MSSANPSIVWYVLGCRFHIQKPSFGDATEVRHFGVHPTVVEASSAARQQQQQRAEQ